MIESRTMWASILTVACMATIAWAANAPASQRTAEAIDAELNATAKQFQQAMPSLSVLTNPQERPAIAPKAVPLLQKMVSLFGEMAAVQKDPAEKAGLAAQRADYQSYLVALGDQQTLASLSVDPTLLAKSALAVGNWWNHANDPAAQQKVLDDYAVLVKAHPTEGGVVDTLSNMWHLGASSDDLKRKIIDILRATVKPEAARELLAEASSWEARKSLEGKPLVVAGRTSTGGKLTSADWKGKVVLVDFWATWCVPCRAELPHLKQMYAAYHDKGLELVGVDCDDADDPVNSFIKENAMPWPQLREAGATDDGWHPLTKQLHVDSIPAMFLIDKKGVVRYVDAAEGLETKIKTLLNENAQ